MLLNAFIFYTYYAFIHIKHSYFILIVWYLLCEKYTHSVFFLVYFVILFKLSLFQVILFEEILQCLDLRCIFFRDNLHFFCQVSGRTSNLVGTFLCVIFLNRGLSTFSWSRKMKNLRKRNICFWERISSRRKCQLCFVTLVHLFFI